MTPHVHNRIERGRYLDSVALMRVSRELGALPGVDAAAAMIGTPSNRRLLAEAGLLAAAGEKATPNDLIIAVRGRTERAALDALQAADGLLVQPAHAADEGLPRARSLAAALELLPQANLALISVPGDFAALEARKALGRGLNVLVFSDNVPIEEEVALKRLARAKNLLFMGPDCGTAIIAGTPIAFANAVPRGEIGIVSASGTGLQEVSTLIARLGGGVSHGIGVGGRDLDARVGALGTLGALDALEADPATKTIVLISKPPSPQVAKKVLARIGRSPKKCVVCFLGSAEPGLARTLTAAAEQAVGRKLPATALKLPKHKKGKIHGLYCGGTLCAEAEVVLRQKKLKDFELVDLGDYQYTRGRPHPMIEPELRNPHVARALADDKVAAILVDVVLGYGSHMDPAGVLAKAVKGAKKPVIASVTGTETDPQVLSRQIATLRAVGVFVAPSNARAAEAAALVVAPQKA
jgi:FdrA protein